MEQDEEREVDDIDSGTHMMRPKKPGKDCKIHILFLLQLVLLSNQKQMHRW